MAFSLHVSLGSSWLWPFLRLSCSQWPWQFWGTLVRCFVECPLAGICLMFFSWLEQRYGFGKEDHRWSTIFITSSQGHLLSTWFMTVRWPWPLCWGRVCQVSLMSSSSLYPFSILSSLEGSPYGHTSELGACTPSFRGNIYINALEFLCMGDLSLLPHLLIYSVMP